MSGIVYWPRSELLRVRVPSQFLAVDGLLQVTSSFSLKFFYFPRVNAGNC